MAIDSKLLLTDMEWSSQGDFVLFGGDLSGTSSKLGMAFIQEVEDRVKSSTDDWKLLPNRGASIDNFKGELNNEDTWKGIESTIEFSLIKDQFLESQDFVVTAGPLSNEDLGVRIDFNTSLTGNLLDSTIIFKIVYDLTGEGPYIAR